MTKVDDQSDLGQVRHKSRAFKRSKYQGLCVMEPAGIEPATSCLQRARDPDQLTVGWRFRP
jgi:hypothetical protein